MKRRDFMKCAAGFSAGLGAGIAFSPLPWQLLDDISVWTQNWPWIPANPKGENTYELSTSKLCPSGCGLKVRLLNGRVLRVLPQAGHPLGGGISPLAAAEPQLLYSPSRLTTPLRRNSEGSHSPISWPEAKTLLLGKLEAAGEKLLCLCGDESGSGSAVLSAFLRARGSEKIFFMPSEAQCQSLAWQHARYADSSLPYSSQAGYDFEKADLVLAIGANIMEAWGTVMRNRRIVAEKGAEKGFPLYYAGPVQNQTAALAAGAGGGWLPIRAGSETSLALGLANVLARTHGKKLAHPAFAQIEHGLARFDPAHVSAVTGLGPRRLEEMCEKLAQAAAPLVVCGSEFGQGAGCGPALSGLLLNLLLRGPLTAVPLHTAALPGARGRADIYRGDIVRELTGWGGRPAADLAIFYEANPAYALPGAAALADKIRAIPFKLAFAPFMDETAALCDLVLPTPLGLEKLDDIESPLGCGKVFYALARPLAEAPGQCRHGADVILELAAALDMGLPANYEAVLRKKAQDMSLSWISLSRGQSFERPAPELEAADCDLSVFDKLLFRSLRAARGASSNGRRAGLAPLCRNALGTPQTGIPPFALKTLRAKELKGGEMYVFANSATARALGLYQDARVSVRAAGGNGNAVRNTGGNTGRAITARFNIFEGIADDCLGAYLGFGHSALDEYSRGKGANICELFSPEPEEGSGLMTWHKTEVTVEVVA
ncbi:MAG: molybdopterin-dependent oxidoreductase [Deltaproteobacteria bacterium]|jgi:anaerobic selenocysteine-containing dehydrogenase|nr:molybdopterin-dependent oxidoreductase [Deltaproteobacteria bacterium]